MTPSLEQLFQKAATVILIESRMGLQMLVSLFSDLSHSLLYINLIKSDTSPYVIRLRLRQENLRLVFRLHVSCEACLPRQSLHIDNSYSESMVNQFIHLSYS